MVHNLPTTTSTDFGLNWLDVLENRARCRALEALHSMHEALSTAHGTVPHLRPRFVKPPSLLTLPRVRDVVQPTKVAVQLVPCEESRVGVTYTIPWRPLPPNASVGNTRMVAQVTTTTTTTTTTTWERLIPDTTTTTTTTTAKTTTVHDRRLRAES